MQRPPVSLGSSHQRSSKTGQFSRVRSSAVTIPLSVHHRFPDVATGLPKPGELSVADADDRQHDSHTFCYRFRSNGTEALLEIFDSDFGAHTARLSRPSVGLASSCPVLSTEGRFFVANSRIGLASTALPDLEGFVPASLDESVSITREWMYRDANGRCWWRATSVEALKESTGFRSIQV